MRLHKLLRLFDPRLSLNDINDVELTGLCEDSRVAQPGNLFVARAGATTSGLNYIADAQQRGAIAVVADQQVAGCSLPQIVIPHAGQAASQLANLFLGSPGAKMHVFGVTGT